MWEIVDAEMRGIALLVCLLGVFAFWMNRKARAVSNKKNTMPDDMRRAGLL